MNNHIEDIKVVTELTPSDFAEYPIWSWYDDDNSLIVPVEKEYLLRNSYDDYDPLFILSDLRLRDDSVRQGFVSLRMTDRQVYMVGFFKGTKIYTFSLVTASQDSDRLIELMAWLKKPLDQIFPVTFVTPFFFNDGKPISGEVNLLKD